jgi:hypothetical protein
MLVEGRNNMNYEFIITVANDSNPIHWRATYANAFDAVKAFDTFVDVGDGDVFRTVNLFEPNGKCHTRNFYRKVR